MKTIQTIILIAAVCVINTTNISTVSAQATQARPTGKLDIFDEKGKLVHRTKDDHYVLDTPFQFGLAGVMVNGKLGFINSKGEMVIPAEYTKSAEIKEGFIALTKNEKAGALNQAGKVVLSFDYKTVSKINLDVYFVEQLDGKKVYLDALGKVTATPKLSAMEVAQIKYRALGTDKNNAIPRADRLLQVCTANTRGLIDVATDTLYHKATGCDRITIVRLNENYSLLVDTNHYANRGYGTQLLKNGDEKVLIEGATAAVSDGYEYYPDEGVLAFQFGKKWGFFTIDGKQIVAPQYDKVVLNLDDPAVSAAGLFMVWKNNNSMVVTRNGTVVPCLGTDCRLLPTGDIEFETKEGFGIQTAKGNVLLPVSRGKKIAYKNGFLLSRQAENISRNSKDWKHIEKIDYEVRGEDREFLQVKKNNKYGYVNSQGQVVVPIEFDGFRESNFDKNDIKLSGLYRGKQNDDLCIGSVERKVPIYCGYTNLKVADNGFSVGQRAPALSSNAKFDFLESAIKLRPENKDEHGFVTALPQLANDQNFNQALEKFRGAADNLGQKFEARVRMDAHYLDPKLRDRENIGYCKGHCRTLHAKLSAEYIEDFQQLYAAFERNTELQKSPHYATLNSTLKAKLDADSKLALAVVATDEKINGNRSFTAQRDEAKAKAEAEVRNVAAISKSGSASTGRGQESDITKLMRLAINAEQKMSESVQLLNRNFSDKDKREFMGNIRGWLRTWYEVHRVIDIELSDTRNGMSATERASLRALTNKKLADMKAWEEKLNNASSGPGFDELVRAFMGIRQQR